MPSPPEPLTPAWRILPAYWAALAFSLVIAWAVVRQPHSAEPTAGSVVVYTLLLQDLIAVPILVVHQGSRWMVGHYYWVDLAIAPAMTMLLLAVVSGRPAALVRLLDSRPLPRLGSFSYSLYLIHLPIVVAISLKLVAPRLGHGIAAFAVTTVLAGGLSLAAARYFPKVFEFPFQRHRSWAALTVPRSRRRELTPSREIARFGRLRHAAVAYRARVERVRGVPATTLAARTAPPSSSARLGSPPAGAFGPPQPLLPAEGDSRRSPALDPHCDPSGREREQGDGYPNRERSTHVRTLRHAVNERAALPCPA